MENYKEEINKLQTQLDELKSKIEKPKFEVGDWVKLTDSYAQVLKKDMCFQILRPQSEDGYCYYVDHFAFGIEDRNFLAPYYHILTKATPKEVEEALTKEAVKRGYTKTNFKCLTGKTVKLYENPKYFYIKSCNRLYYGTPTNANCVFENGTWATLIKTKTIDEIGLNFSSYMSKSQNTVSQDLAKYLTENKQEIIETLNNL